jgi:alginate O-acetyltransferase complex protein AlgI
MLFQSQVFVLVFLPASLSLYYLAARSERARQYVLIAASLFFYGWWDVRFVPLLLAQVCSTWYLADQHARSSGGRTLLYLGIALNLASLATFKYLDFVLTSIEAVVGFELPRAHFVLPIGISFFSFQLISYLVDLMRKAAPVYPLRRFALFVVLFPHLIAGPIVRHNELISQLAFSPLRSGFCRRLGIGTCLFTLGLAKKVILADKLGHIADPLFTEASKHLMSFGEAWAMALAFSLQLFLDFSAYTEMAIGIALMFGLLLPENFRRPYLATDLRDFWRRWHISLSNFIRDYLYIPLGGSHAGPVRYVMATIVSMGLCGLWHGAGWTYVVWGVWHGAGLAICRFWHQLQRPLPTAVAWLITMLFVLVGWVLFRAADFATAASILSSMVGVHGFAASFSDTAFHVTFAASVLVAALVPSAHQIVDGLIYPRPAIAIAAGLIAASCILLVGNGAPFNFIYFRF